MYLINLTCSCQIELSPAHRAPIFHRSNRCVDEHNSHAPYLNARIATPIIDVINADEVLAEFDFDAEADMELTGTEVFH